MKVFSVDAETDGLYGLAFAIAATVRVDGVEVASFSGCVSDAFVSNAWVRENVLPALGDMPITHPTQVHLEESFWQFWMANREGSACIAHCGSPVESGLFRRCVERDVTSRQFSGPFPLHELGTLLLSRALDPTSIDSVINEGRLTVPFSGVPHHPMYDAAAAAVVWEYFTSH